MNKFWVLCLRPHFLEIIKIEKSFNKNYPIWSYDFYGSNCTDYKWFCKDSVCMHNDIYDVYTKWSWKLLYKNIITDQRFILWWKIIDSQNIDFYLLTDRDARDHRSLYHSWQCFWWWFLTKDDLDKKIYVYGYSCDLWWVHTKLYPVISDIFGKEFPEYEVVFWNPRYHSSW